MALAGTSYQLVRSTGRCASSGRRFADGDHYVATLIERDSGLFERQDFSNDAWSSGARPAEGAFAIWQATYHEHATEKKPLLGDDELLDLFEQLAEATEPKQIAFRYVLALLLVRKRLLKSMGSKPRTVDRPAQLLVAMRSAPPEQPHIVVIDPSLDEATIAEVIEQVGQIIPHDS